MGKALVQLCAIAPVSTNSGDHTHSGGQSMWRRTEVRMVQDHRLGNLVDN